MTIYSDLIFLQTIKKDRREKRKRKRNLLEFAKLQKENFVALPYKTVQYEHNNIVRFATDI